MYSLPELKRKAKDSLTKTLVDLAALPPPPSSQPFAELLKLLTGFCEEVVQSIEGMKGHEKLMQSCRGIYESFKGEIAATHPKFIPFTRNIDWQITLQHEDDHVEMAREDHLESLLMAEARSETLEAVSPPSPVAILHDDSYMSPTEYKVPSEVETTKCLRMNLTDMRAHLKR
jgi:hypothetical protein